MQDGVDYGRFEIILDEYLVKNKISKNAFAEQANLQRTQLNNYCKNNIKRPDFDVLARMCYALNCELADIVRYARPRITQEETDNGSIE